MLDLDAVVIGAGAVGLACAASLSKAGKEVFVLDAANAIGTGTSARNSEVIHAGIYYPTGSLKAQLCVEGRRRLYQWLDERGLSHKKLGKLIVSTHENEDEKLDALLAKGRANGVEGLRELTRDEISKMEPALRCHAALLSEETGILDAQSYMLSLRGAIEDSGGHVVLNSPVTSIGIDADGRYLLRIGGADPYVARTPILVNAAGLYAHELAATMDGYSAKHLPEFSLAKGSYFSCSQRSPFSHLIYPVPDDGGLGVHVTLDMTGALRFGPDVEWLDHSDPRSIDYRVDIRRADGFYQAIRQYWPGLEDGSIQPAYSGCRPKLSVQGAAPADFLIDGPDEHQHGGLVHLLGIESPGLTCSLAIAECVKQTVVSST